MIGQAELEQLLARFAEKRVLVVGDLMLDEFIWGRVSRISPEAPVPVVEVQKESNYPGGAANVARNLRRFTPHVSVLGVVGKCSMGEKLAQLLRDDGIETAGVIASAEYQTIVKTRIIARQQQVVRVDRESKKSLPPSVYAELSAAFDQLLPQIDALILEDYGKGLLTQQFADLLIQKAQVAGKIITVDPNPNNPLSWTGVDAVKPNRLEAFASAGVPYEEATEPTINDKPLGKVAGILMEKWGTRLLLITLGEHGMFLVNREGMPYHTPTRAKQVFDLSGAGDTAIALFTLALASGAEPSTCAEVANHASGVVVGKLGTETLSPQELLESFLVE